MSKLDLSADKAGELISELCPGGVEYKTLGEIALEMYRGSGIKKDEVTTEGIPCVRYGEIYTKYNIWFDSCFSHTKLEYVSNPKYFEYGDILFAITGESVEDIAKSIAYVGKEKCLAGGDIVVMKHKQNPKYLSYALSTANVIMQKGKGKVKSKVVHSSVPAIQEIQIPIPPLAVQSEIVRILDNFTELTAELTARKKQYEYYRDSLLTFGVDIPMVKLGDIAKYSDTRIKNSDIKPYSYVSVENLLQQKRGVEFTDKIPEGKNSIEYLENDILIGNIRPYLRKIWISDRNGGTNGDVLTIRILSDYQNRVNPKYLYYQLSSEDFFNYDNQFSKGAKMPRGSKEAVLRYEIPLPPLEIQERIVNVLDNFDAICSDLKIGLPAEIKARKKQYEYYRDLLLTFKTSANTILTEQNRTEQNRTEQNRTEQMR